MKLAHQLLARIPRSNRFVSYGAGSGLLFWIGLALAQPISLHPQNSHYFLYHDKPAVLITSAEHYGAVLNLDFDYAQYLKTLEEDGMNLTRIFTGAYVEPQGAFNIARNTLAPAEGRFICPWARSDEPGYPNGGNKFDLTQWDPAYFERLKDFVSQAEKRGVIVEVCLFCPFYKEDQWKLSPQNAANNVNGIGNVSRNEVYTLDKNGGLLAVQEQMVRKIVSELKGFDNLYYELCNEPYFGGVTMDWQRHMADLIVSIEKDFPRQHLISRNVANGKKKVENPHPAVSIFNFHYATPPVTVGMNYGLNKVIGDNETGFKGQADTHYRMEGWEFILAGGALYNNLDYSFAAGFEDGTFDYPDAQPGGGSAALREQLRILSEFIHSFDFVAMQPDHDLVRHDLGNAGHTFALAETGKQYAIYVFGGNKVNLELDVPPGRYRLEWLNVLTGQIEKETDVRHGQGRLKLTSPEYETDIALRVVAESSP